MLRAISALHDGRADQALETLQASVPHELGLPRVAMFALFGALYPVYVRGQAFLALHQGENAAIEFQKILNHRGIVVSDPIGALAHLQAGRAHAMAGHKEQAQEAYEDFLSLWKDADPDIPVLKQAQAEYSRLINAYSP